MDFWLLHSSSNGSAIVGTFRPTYTSASSCVTIIGTILWTTNSSMETQQVEQLKEWQNDHQSLQSFLQIAQTNANRVQSVSTDPSTNNPIQYVRQPLPLSTYNIQKSRKLRTHDKLKVMLASTYVQKSVAFRLSRLWPSLSYDQIPKKLDE